VGNSTYASILVSPSTMAPLLPKVEKLADHEARVLYCYKSIKSGPYRVSELARVARKHPEANIPQNVEELISRGYLKRNKAGAIQITTSGKNAYATNPLTTY
jgi:hypothetical protein